LANPVEAVATSAIASGNKQGNLMRMILVTPSDGRKLRDRMMYLGDGNGPDPFRRKPAHIRLKQDLQPVYFEKQKNIRPGLLLEFASATCQPKSRMKERQK
jgi:hypothetical protein